MVRVKGIQIEHEEENDDDVDDVESDDYSEESSP
jgi:hypothetical protein